MTEPYLLAGQLSELERLQLQARVWNPFGESLLAVWTAELQGACSTSAAVHSAGSQY